ncbi:hypothetical protein B0H14DRAFT_3137203 [Mycena olivaceomarginata]|nr:hypothetical protein B0H14DRAFT_3174192 [Mycena olivaceomarginata]KAJ7808183.1 hypothetical protein B0H14DRAFT_3152194 [Mycena olivaceomarginata]KAJ7852045.1 hypothetical protein B0H14DRAFT_3137203 [Mycena olivaceomarginata]
MEFGEYGIWKQMEAVPVAPVSGLAAIKFGSFSRRAFKDLSDDEVNTLFEYINGVNKREVDARCSNKDAIKDVAGSSLTSAALQGVEKIFGTLAERSLNELD